MRESQLLQTLPDVFLLVGHDGVVHEHLGGGAHDPVLCAAQMPGRALESLWPAGAAEQARHAVRRALTTRGSERFELRLSLDDVVQWYEVRVFVRGRKQVLLILRNVTDERAQDQGRQRAASCDTATGLPGREMFTERLSAALAEARLKEQGLAVVLLSLDGARRVGEALGQGVADLLLQEVARVLTRSLREADRVTLIGGGNDAQHMAALGGDTFALLLTDLRLREEARAVERRLRAAVREPLQIQGRAFKVELSIGICLYPSDGRDVETLLKHAHSALGEARLAGRSEAEFYSDTMRLRPLNRLDLESELRFAIEQAQLELHFQPRGNARSFAVTGVEALLRWPHPVRGSVPLEELIPLAEATGLELPIGDWALRSVCAQLRAWREQGIQPGRLALNLWHQQFALDDLPERIAAALTSAGLDGALLELDLTERMLMRARDGMRLLQRCKDLGVRIMLDDFGTGYSSLGHLSKLPIDGLKIDRSFVQRIEDDARSRAACSAIIALAQQLGLLAIAEGVESQAQLEYLLERGCDEIQGHLYCRALPAAELGRWLQQAGGAGQSTAAL